MDQSEEKQKMEEILKDIYLGKIDLLQLKDNELKEIIKAYDYELKNHKKANEILILPDLIKVYIILTDIHVRKEIINNDGWIDIRINEKELRSKVENFAECEKYLKQYDHI